MTGLFPRLREPFAGGVACRMADWSIKPALPQLRLRLPRRSLSIPAGKGGTGGTESSCTSLSVINPILLGEACTLARCPSFDRDVRVNWSAEDRYAGCIPISGAWYECGRAWKALGMFGTSVGAVVNDMVETSAAELGKSSLADLGRDLERRKGDEKRRRLFASLGMSTVAEERIVVFSVVVGVKIDSSSLEAS